MKILAMALATVAAALTAGATPASAQDSPVPTQGLKLWLRADAGITADATRVSQWADQSGGSTHAKQEEADSQPTLVNNAIAGKPVLRFDGVDDFMTFTLPVNGLSGMTIFLVAANSEDVDGGEATGCGCRAESAAVFWNETESWGTVYVSPFQSQVNWRFGTTQTGNWPIYKRPTSIGNRYSLTVTRKDGTTDSLYVDGVPVMSEGGKEAMITGCQDEGNLGRGYNDDTFFPGDIAEVLVYDRALPDAERQSVEQYLITKYR